MPALRSWFSSLRVISKSISGYSVLCELVAVVAAVSALVAPTSVLTATLIVVTVVLVLVGPVAELLAARRDGVAPGLMMGNGKAARLLVVVGAMAIDASDGVSRLGVFAGVLLCFLMAGEEALRKAVRSAQPQVANIPGWEVPLPSVLAANVLYWIDLLGMVVLVVSALTELSQVTTLVVAIVGLVLAVVIGVQAIRYLYGRNRFEANLPSILERLAPEFAFHWQAPAGTAYQATMWLPYLARIGRPYFVLVRTQANFEEVSRLTDAPVILRSGLDDLDLVVCPSLKVVFYANTAVRNSHMIRFPHLTHIQLNHGDSDKIASFSPTFRQYDKNFVAGQAAVDRFANHGVATRADQFVIVGRPQLEDVASAPQAISEVTAPTVLYSPTWSGFYEDSDYSSLSAAPQIVQALLDRGCTVIFRPHPYARKHKGNALACSETIDLLAADAKESGRQHVFGPAAETELSLVDCFNASDAMVSDVSSVVSDYLVSGKPFAMAAVSAHGDAFAEEFPQAAAAYVFDVEGGAAVGFDAVLDDLLGADPKREVRRELRTYYLSDTPPEQAAERFLEIARTFLD
jgi:hypothetical protein